MSRCDNMNIQTGDIYQLGQHKLICGDSSNPEYWHQLLQDEQADLLITDPPYGVNMEQKSKTILKKQQYSKITNDNIPLTQLGTILLKTFQNCKKHLKPDSSYYIFSPQGGDSELMMMMMMRQAGIKCRHQLIWMKERPVFSMGRLDYDYQHEPILYGWTNKHHFYNRNKKQKSSIQQFKQIKNRLHPTSKPPLLIGTLMNNNTQQGMTVIDCFGGGGTTLLVAEKLHRKCRMIEIDPHYVGVIIQRWEAMTKQKAEKIT